jgi:hypothetical protein
MPLENKNEGEAPDGFGVSCDGASVLGLQRALAEAVFTADPRLLEADPEGFARRRGLPPGDQAAFRAFQGRLLFYRDLVRGDLREPVEDVFPCTRSLLQRDGLWEPCMDAFLEARPVQSPFYRDVAPAFLGWLAESRWGQDRFPFLLSLTHCEMLPSLVTRYPDRPGPGGLHAVPAPEDRLVLDPATQVVAYDHGVHLCTPQNPVPAPVPVQLLVHRDREGGAAWRVLTPATTALLTEGQRRPLGEVFRSLGLGNGAQALQLLEELHRQGAIRGFGIP